MIPERLLRVLRSIEDRKSPLAWESDTLVCPATGVRYDASRDIPSLMKGGPATQEWNVWDSVEIHKIGDSYYKRAKGELPEKEASRSFARLLRDKGIYAPGNTILDIGCATGHFLLSFRRHLDPEVRYTGLDSHLGYLRWGGEIYGIDDRVNFVHADALEMPFVDRAFDIVVVNLFHFFENAEMALREAMRVAKKAVVWRTPVGQVNYVVKVVYAQEFEKIGALTPGRTDVEHSLYMLYSKRYIEGLVRHLGGRVMFIERDTDFGEFDNTALSEFDGLPATRTFHGLQINGNLVLDWHYVAIETMAK
jgi:ubiquinone/menaquinone biosynthesis C-methylase UbiE